MQRGWADAVVGVAVCGLFGVEVLLNAPVGVLGWGAATMLSGLLAGAMAVGRRWPLLSFLLVAVGLAYLVLTSVGSAGYTVAVIVAGFLLGRRAAKTRPAVLAFTGLALAALVYVSARAVLWGRWDTQVMQWLWMVLGLLVVGVFPWFGGRFLRQRAELVRAGWERAEQLEREQAIVTERERLRERARIAQDMHDSLGHALALVTLRAGALEMARDLPEQHRQAMGELRASAGEAVETLHAIIGLLGESGTPDTVDELVERARASGVDVTARTEGDVPDGLVGVAVRRVVQEALTNVAKHAPGVAVTVLVSGEPGLTLVSILNEPTASAPASGGRRGLIGLRERVRLLGGTFLAGPHNGGFAVHARIPHASPALPEETTETVHDRARRRVRRGFLFAISMPTAIITSLVALMIGYYTFSVTNSVLDPAEFARFHIGQSRAEVEEVLPDMQMMDPPRLANPPGAGCRYYRGNGDVFDFRAPVLRLCFDATSLVAKDDVPR
ncbi:sensor histidine kinase [Actinokineospora enzanensis]|uniref:sensor histidine kinase n=1 Tax=Actinokineospora enzanensis TaxID=155975 RepID=UPI000362DFA6|nr:histidine kinase [Actinokineospora enzanensis]